MFRRPHAKLLDKLMIVESPNKVQSLTSYVATIQREISKDLTFGSNRFKKVTAVGQPHERVVVMATVGHFQEMQKVLFESYAGDPKVLASATVSSGGKKKKGGKKSAKGGAAPDVESPPSKSVAETFLKPGDRIYRPVFEPSVHARKNINAIVNFLKEHKSAISEVILATDPDREGELIASHVLSYVQGFPYSRAYISAITKEGVVEALKERQVLFVDHSLATAANTRHIMDRMFGFLGSRFLNNVDQTIRSVGRVQTPSLILINEREEKIHDVHQNGKVTFSVVVHFLFPHHNGTKLKASVVFQQDADKTKDNKTKKHQGNGGATFGSQAEGKESLEKLGLKVGSDAATFTLLPWSSSDTQYVKSVEHQTLPPPPLTLQALILEAGKKLKMSTEEVSRSTQTLFQDGLITYPRTDSTRINETTIQAKIYPYIQKTYGQNYVLSPEKLEELKAATTADEASGKKKVMKKSKSDQKAVAGNVEDAHEAIHPTNFEHSADDLARRGLLKDSKTKAMYELIHGATVASFMIPKKTETVAVQFGVQSAKDQVKGTITLRAKKVLEKGWQNALESSAVSDSLEEEEKEDKKKQKGENADDSEDDEEDGETLFTTLSELSPQKLKEDQKMFEVVEVEVKEKKQSPPAHFTEGTLIQELKNKGIGRPSTYPAIVRTLTSRDYIRVNAQTQKIGITSSGLRAVELSKKCFPAFVDINFTANFEKKLDSIAKSVMSGDKVLNAFWSDLMMMVTLSTRQLKNCEALPLFSNFVYRCKDMEHCINMLKFYFKEAEGMKTQGGVVAPTPVPTPRPAPSEERD